MKIIVTGSLGNISQPLTQSLVKAGHAVTVISSKSGKQEAIEALGAAAAIGALQDVDFLTATFTGADAVYIMVPPNYRAPDMIAYYRETGDNYVKAVQRSGVKRVVHLSSYGAHLDKGTGVILGSHHVEEMLNGLPGVSITHMRPAYFYYNLYAFVEMIKKTGLMAANYGGDDRIVMVSPLDIAAAIAEEITAAIGSPVRYVASDVRTASEIASVLGRAIGKPDLTWLTISEEETRKGMEANGVPANLASLLVELNGGIHSGKLTEDYDLNPPALGKVKLEDFAREFAAVFNKK
jgi:uncharacterized protein YbjT (DUF2867 family)